MATNKSEWKQAIRKGTETCVNEKHASQIENARQWRLELTWQSVLSCAQYSDSIEHLIVVLYSTGESTNERTARLEFTDGDSRQ